MSPEKNYLALSDLDTESIRRKKDAHKGSHGSVAILGGQDGMLGALLLASRAAVLSGSGRVYAFALATDKLSLDYLYPEVMLKPLGDFENMIAHMDAIVIGPGLGQSSLAEKLLMLCLSTNKPLAIDADALNIIAAHPDMENMLIERQGGLVLTPHPGEASRLLNKSIETVQENRIDSALSIANKYNCCCVLKGANSVCACPTNEYWINQTGNPGLASAGTGDVLSGVIGSFIAQGMSCMNALKLGIYVHGLAADRLVDRGVGPIGLTASEVALEIRQLLNTLH